jgi:hypothetical protein
MDRNSGFVINMMALMCIHYRMIGGMAARIDAEAMATLIADEMAPIPAMRMGSPLGFHSRNGMRAWMERFGVSLSVPTGRRHGSCRIPEDIWDEPSRSPIPASAEVVNASEGLKRIASKLGVATDSDADLHAIEAIEDACLAERNHNQDLMESQNANGG